MPARKPTGKPKKTPPLTVAEAATAQAEVGAYFDGEIARVQQRIAEVEEKLATARRELEQVTAAKTAWYENGQITRDGSDLDPTSWEFRNLCTEVMLAAGSRATRLALPLVQPGARPDPIRRLEADAAYTRAELLKRWMHDAGYPLLDGI